MENIFTLIKATRHNFLQLIEGLSLEALNKVPDGFNNNVIWNFGHIISTQQVLCYTRSQLEPMVEQHLIGKYRKGTRPEAFVAQEELDLLKQYLYSTLEQTANDFEQGVFTVYDPIKTSMGIEIASAKEAFQAVAMHDGLHLGYAMALRKLVKK
ncbi:DinB family protein [Pontibacter sp. 13R65]|uniref:DinB family protein n=1 Tax=Pontibacter sp. 13R65 TaxID=3127458 RepID=UPI00301BB775